MAQLYYRYGTMNSGKSMDALKVAYNYEEQGKRVLFFVPALDDRYKVGQVTSRTGFSREAKIITKDTDLVEETRAVKPDCVLVDEAQFLSEDEVKQLTRIVDELHIPVICYGLKNDYRNDLFAGSRALLIYADKIEEIKTVCWYCNKKATMILKFKAGHPVYTGEQIEIGGNDTYKSVCRYHYYHPFDV